MTDKRCQCCKSDFFADIHLYVINIKLYLMEDDPRYNNHVILCKNCIQKLRVYQERLEGKPVNLKKFLAREKRALIKSCKV